MSLNKQIELEINNLVSELVSRGNSKYLNIFGKNLIFKYKTNEVYVKFYYLKGGKIKIVNNRGTKLDGSRLVHTILKIIYQELY